MNLPESRRILFSAGGLRAQALDASELPELQRFFEANPLYFETVNGAPPRPDEAAQEFHDRPPAHMPYDRVWVIGVRDDAGDLVAMASVLENLLAPEVWHIGLYIVATHLHGSGSAAALHDGLQAWIVANGARWIRLGVVAGNARALRFWTKLGYVEVRQRQGMSLRVKTLGDASLADYLQRVERDRPESTSP